MDSEQIVFTIIVHAGDARSHALEALRYARENNFVAAEESMAKAKENLLKAHQIQTELLQAEARGEKKAINKPKEVLEFEKKNSGKKKVKVRDGSTGG